MQVVGVGCWGAGDFAAAWGSPHERGRGAGLEAGVAGNVVGRVYALGAGAGWGALLAGDALDAAAAVASHQQFGNADSAVVEGESDQVAA